jgi:hypothetical protein
VDDDASRRRLNTSMDMQAHTAGRDLIIEEIVARTGIGEAMIERLVRAFYGRVRLDPFIGPIFESKVGDWETHIARICAFWSSGRADERPLSRPTDGGPPAAADRYAAF